MSTIQHITTSATTVPTHVDRLIGDHFAVRDGELQVGGCRIGELVSTYGSPLFVYDATVMRKKLADLRRTFSGRVDVHYSVKANPAQEVLKTFIDKGCGLEIASSGELEQALAAGCPAERLLFAGPGKRDDELAIAVENNVGEIHLESLREAQRLNEIANERNRTVRVALRINPAEAVQGGAMRMGGKPSPFGIDEESLGLALDTILQLSSLRVTGIHLFTGTQILDHDILLKQYGKAVELACKVAAQLPHALETIDFGGGLGIPYFERESELNLTLLAQGFEKLLADINGEPMLAKTRLIVEPGRFLVGEAGIYVAQVLDLKESRGKKFAVVDGGMHHHLAASGNLGQTIKRNYPLAVLSKLDQPASETLDVVGPLCTPLDVLGRAAELPKVEEGDLIGVFQSGAYGRTSSPHGFLSHPAPAEVLVNEGSHHLIRRRGCTEDWLQDQRCGE